MRDTPGAIVQVEPDSPDPAAIARAAALLREGRLVAFPTETVYGLGANALDEVAVRRIFAAKGRPAHNPLIVHVPEVGAARRLSSRWPEVADRLAEAFWPGPLTLVVARAPEIPDAVTAGLAAVALRVPAHPVALALLRAAGVPVAAPSANRSTSVSPTRAAHVRKSLGAAVDLILDGGPTDVGIESTVLDLTGDRPMLLRPGLLSADRIAAVAGPLAEPGRAARRSGEARTSPGMDERHYAPRARLVLAAGDGVQRALSESGEAGRPVGALVRTAPAAAAAAMHVKRLPEDPAGYARGLYHALHQLDDLGCEVVVVETVPDGAAWAGIRDRLTRAAHPGGTRSR